MSPRSPGPRWDEPLVSEKRESYGSFGERKLSLLCKGLGASSHASKEAFRVFRGLSHSWADRPLESGPAWRSDITDDGTPFEFSIAFDGGAPRIRMLIEAQKGAMTLASSWAAGLELNERLGRLPHVDLERFNRVRELFAPVDGEEARFALWHAAELVLDNRTSYKVYLNPQLHGPQSARGALVEALTRLGARSAHEFLERRLDSSDDGTRLAYLSLDLTADPGSRIKVYLANAGIRAEDIEPALAGTQNYVPGDGARWIRQLLGTGGPFRRRPLLTCFSFTASGDPPCATLHVPIRDYAPHDEYSVERACEFLTPNDAKTLRRAVGLFACRPLDIMSSVLTYVSLRRVRGGLNVTTYIAPEAFTTRESGRHPV